MSHRTKELKKIKLLKDNRKKYCNLCIGKDFLWRNKKHEP